MNFTTPLTRAELEIVMHLMESRDSYLPPQLNAMYFYSRILTLAWVMGLIDLAALTTALQTHADLLSEPQVALAELRPGVN